MEFNRAFDPFRALQSSFKAFVQAPLPILVGGVLLLLTSGGGPHVEFVFRDVHSWRDSWREIRHVLVPLVPVIGVCGCIGLALFLVSCWVGVGFANTVEEIERKGHGRVESVFQSKGRFGPMVLARLLVILIWIATGIPMMAAVFVIAAITHGFHRNEELALLLIPAGLVWVVPAFYVWLGVSLTDQAVALEGLPPVEAVKRSWSLVSGHRLMLLLFYIVTGIFSALGFCLCCIGLLWTGTLAETARTDGYLALVRGDRSDWWIEKGHPLPAPVTGWGPPPSPPPPSPPISV